MLIYKRTIEDLAQFLGYPEMGEGFKGNPSNPEVFEEYYLWNIPSFFRVRDFLINRISRKWELTGNVITIYVSYGNPTGSNENIF